MQDQDQDDEPRANEPAELRRQTKSQIYDALAERFFLPKKCSKGVNRRYLVGVYLNEHYRVDLREMKRFEAELTTAQLKKAPLLNLTDLFHKLSGLCQEYGYRPFGFAPNVVPEEKWLLSITRYIDRANLTAAFLRSLPNPNPLPSVSQRVRQAQERAKQFVMLHVPQNNSKVNQQKTEVWEVNRKRINLTKEVEEARRHSQRLQERLVEVEGEVMSKISTLTTTILSHVAVALDRPGLADISNQESRELFRMKKDA